MKRQSSSARTMQDLCRWTERSRSITPSSLSRRRRRRAVLSAAQAHTCAKKDGSSDALALTSGTQRRAIIRRAVRDNQTWEDATNCCFQKEICRGHNETCGDTSRLTQSNQNENKHLESCTLSLHPSPPSRPGPLFSLKHFLMTEQTNPDIFGLFGFWWKGRRVQISNHILFLLLYVWLGGAGEQEALGPRGADEGEGRG